MNTFKDLKIEAAVDSFVGDKISITKLLDVSIRVHAFKISPSKKREGTDLLTLQIEKDGDKRVVFSGGKYLMKQIKLVPEGKFPFETTIIKSNDHLEFT